MVSALPYKIEKKKKVKWCQYLIKSHTTVVEKSLSSNTELDFYLEKLSTYKINFKCIKTIF